MTEMTVQHPQAGTRILQSPGIPGISATELDAMQLPPPVSWPPGTSA